MAYLPIIRGQKINKALTLNGKIDTLVIVLYDRYANLAKWLKILEQTDRPKNVVVIHNTDGTEAREFSEGTTVIRRKNVGFDIGAFQDVCRDRLPGFPADWQNLLWVTDDTFPMRPDYLDYFALQDGEGVRCMEISNYVRPHIRTTGFSISRSTAQKLKFPADPITTKQHCYLFEHRWYGNIFLDQVKRMGLKVIQVAPNESSPLFDTGYHRRVKRETELNQLWGFDLPAQGEKVPGVTIICPIYRSFPAVISSLIMQTYKNWRLILIHDGPETDGIDSFIRAVNDDRIEFTNTPEHRGAWGHSIRAEWLQKVKSEYVVITNPDNYYMPVFFERLLAPFTAGRDIVATYCSAMVHSYLRWETQPTRLARGHLDCGGVVLKTAPAQLVGWHSMEHSADWFFFEDIIKRYGGRKFIPVKGTLFVHN